MLCINKDLILFCKILLHSSLKLKSFPLYLEKCACIQSVHKFAYFSQKVCTFHSASKACSPLMILHDYVHYQVDLSTLYLYFYLYIIPLDFLSYNYPHIYLYPSRFPLSIDNDVTELQRVS